MTKNNLGQHFLINTKVAELMAKSLDITPRDFVVEVGPGKGAITDYIVNLLDGACKFLGIELDSELEKDLTKKYAQKANIKFINQSILHWLQEFKGTKHSLKIVGSLPYYITTPILHGILQLPKLPKKCVFLVQKDFAEKLTAKEPRGAYIGALMGTFFKIEPLENVPKQHFSPVPKVDSTVIQLTKKTNDDIKNRQKYKKFIKHAFANPRKMLNKNFNVADLQKTGISPTMRPQNVSKEQWTTLYNIVNNNRKN